MGIISDICESIAERGYDDPRRYVGSGAFNASRTGRVSYTPVNLLKRKHPPKNTSANTGGLYGNVVGQRSGHSIPPKTKTSQEIIAELNELENIRYNNNMVEKTVLWIQNNADVQSFVVNELLAEIITQVHESNDYITELKAHYKVTPDFPYQIKEISSTEIKKNLLMDLYWALDMMFSNDFPIARDVFRKIVKDMSKLTVMLDDKTAVQPSKLEVERIFMDHCHRDYGMVVCQNCGHKLLNKIPYCFKCSEGRF